MINKIVYNKLVRSTWLYAALGRSPWQWEIECSCFETWGHMWVHKERFAGHTRTQAQPDSTLFDSRLAIHCSLVSCIRGTCNSHFHEMPYNGGKRPLRSTKYFLESSDLNRTQSPSFKLASARVYKVVWVEIVNGYKYQPDYDSIELIDCKAILELSDRIRSLISSINKL